VLTINTQNVSSPILQSIDIRDAFSSVDLLDKSTQTLINKLDQGVQTIDSQTLINKLDQGVQTKPELHIDLSSTSFDIEKELTSESLLKVLPHDMDPLLLEAYLPVPELIKLMNF
jgi:hypothetical protein